MPIHHDKFNCMEVGESKIFSIKSKMTRYWVAFPVLVAFLTPLERVAAISPH